MKLPFLDRFNKKNQVSYFLVLVLRTEKAHAVIFEEQEGKIKVLGQQEEYFSHSIEDTPIEEFLDILDKAISKSESALPPHIETQRTIFGVKESWAEHNQIKKEYLVKLKKASDELGLIPIGFLVISQAIAHLMQEEEGAPISAILVDAGNTFVTVSLIRAGRIIESKTSEIHDSIPFTVDALLKHFQAAEILPSRIIVFNGKEDLSQEFISHTFSKSLPFLHLPQITTLPFGAPAKAVLFGAATQMGFEVLAEAPKFKAASKSEGQKEQEKTQVGELEFGFVKDQDLAKEEGIKDVSEVETESKSKETVQKSYLKPTFFTDKFLLLKNLLKKAFVNLLTLEKFLPRFSILSFTPKGKTIVGIFSVFVILIGIILFYLLGIKTTIVLSLTPKIIEKDKTVSFSTNSNTNPQKNTIASEVVSVSLDGTTKTPTTGKKDVGTKSKGTVTIFNISNNTVSLPANTIITSSNGLKFTLDNLVIVASGSGDAISGTKPATSNVNVTASDIGVEYNLPSNIKFSLGNNTEVAAKNDSPFSGGTKKQITVVSKEDIKKLTETLPKNLEAKAKEELAKKISKDRVLLPIFLSTTLQNEKVNSLGEEVKVATLKATVLYQGLSYKKNDINSLASTLLQNDVPKDLTFDLSNIKVDVLDINEKKNEEFSANLKLKALLLPKIDQEKIKKQIAGKSLESTQNQLAKLPQVSNVHISQTPNLPLLPKRIPTIHKNIQIITHINE